MGYGYFGIQSVELTAQDRVAARRYDRALTARRAALMANLDEHVD